MMRLALFLFFLGLGIACLVGGLFVTRQTWRRDIEPFNRRSRFFQIALHPERFAMREHLSTIRSLNILGVALLLCAVAIVSYDVFVVISAGK